MTDGGNIKQVKIDISIKIKTAFVKVRSSSQFNSKLISFIYVTQQIKDPKKVVVVWVRGKRNLDSQVGEINPETHTATIDDVFKMKTSLEYDMDRCKFEPKMSVI